MAYQASKNNTEINNPLPPQEPSSILEFIQKSLNWFVLHKYFFFIAIALVSILVVMAAVYKVGFGAMASKADLAPERLRDFTFPIWQQYSFLKHGFLVFLSSNDFAEGKAYANHSTLYLLFMNVLYHVQLAHERLSMRISGAYVAMIASLLAISFVSASQLRNKFEFKKSILVLLGLLYFLTMPSYWIALGKFNVDNGFIFIFPILVVVAYGFLMAK